MWPLQTATIECMNAMNVMSAMGYSAWPNVAQSLALVAVPSQRPFSVDLYAQPSMLFSHLL